MSFDRMSVNVLKVGMFYLKLGFDNEYRHWEIKEHAFLQLNVLFTPMQSRWCGLNDIFRQSFSA